MASGSDVRRSVVESQFGKSPCQPALYLLQQKARTAPPVPIEDVAGTIKNLLAQSKGPAFGALGSERQEDPPCALGAAGHGRADRVLANEQEPEKNGVLQGLRRARHRLRAAGPAGMAAFPPSMTKSGLKGQLACQVDDVVVYGLRPPAAAIAVYSSPKVSEIVVSS
jgi:hypothetical protein